MFKCSLKIVLHYLTYQTTFLRLSERSSAVTLLLHAGWMMLRNASDQGEANSVTIAPLAHEIPATAFLENHWLPLGF